MSFNYLKSFCSLLENTEVPPRFAIWCGIGSVLAALERRVWINQGIYTIYPNFYMVLVAASGQKKSTAINTASRLLRKLSPSPNVISQKITPEALIQALQAQSKDPKKLLKTKNGGIVIADELATFLDRNALERGLGPILTALYDCTTFEYQTMNRGTETITDGYLSLLGGTTIELLKNSLPKDAIGGGFTSRTIFIYEEAIPPPVPWIDYDESLVEIENQCVAYLQRLMELNGTVQLTPEAKALYISDYKDRHYNGGFRDDPMLRQYENRRHAHLLKVAMALMVCEEPKLVMDVHHVRGAKVILEEAEVYLPRVIELIMSTDVGLVGNIVYQFILSRGSVTRSELVRQFCHKMDAEELSKVLNTLIQAHRVRADTQGGKMIYYPVTAKDPR